MTDFRDRRTGEVSDPMERLYGSQDVEGMFPGGAPKAGVPWPQMSRRRDRQDYDKALVHEHLGRQFDEHQLVDVDPRGLRASQPSLTRPGVQHYLSGAYEQTGLTFADQSNPGNRHPVVYSRAPLQEGGEHQDILLSGHHRAAAALLKGEPLRARRIEGGWGPKR